MDFISRAPRATIRRTPHCTTLDNNAAISHDMLLVENFVYHIDKIFNGKHQKLPNMR